MRIRFMTILLISGLVTCSLVAVAEEALTAHVPFAFVAGVRTFPAGDYRVNKGESGSVILLQGAGHAAAFLTVAAEPDAYRDAATLVFERHGGSMFLSAVRMPGERDRVLLTVSLPMKSSASGLTSIASSR